MGRASFDADVTAAVKLFTVDESASVVNNPRQTLAPKADPKSRGSEALDVLRRLRFEPGRLEDVGPLAVGGMSAIRVARQVSLDRDVAVKRLPPEKRLTQIGYFDVNELTRFDERRDFRRAHVHGKNILPYRLDCFNTAYGMEHASEKIKNSG